MIIMLVHFVLTSKVKPEIFGLRGLVYGTIHYLRGVFRSRIIG